MSLTATPAEFDAGFVEVLKGYREVRQSLAKQAEATQEVLQAAKAASAKKAGEAMTKAVKHAPADATTKAPGTVQTSPDGGLDDGDDENGGNEPQPSAATAAGGDSYDLFG